MARYRLPPMGTFSDFLKEKKITAPMIVRTSARLEAGGKEGRTLLKSRATKRRTDAAKTYADAGLNKPASDRGVGTSLVQAAMNDKPLPRRARAKLVKAVAELLKKSGGTVDHKILFGEVASKKGVKVEKAAA